MHEIISETARIRWTGTGGNLTQIIIFRITVFTLQTGSRWLVGDEIARLQVSHLRANLYHLCGCLMSEYDWLRNENIPITHLLPVVNVRAADSGGEGP